MQTLTDRQRQTLDVIRGYIAQNDRPPTYSDIGRGLGTSSQGGVVNQLTALAKKGYIERELHISRGVKLTRAAEPNPRRRIYQIPVQGLIADGAPIEPISDPDDVIRLTDDLAGEGAYALRVRGHSMMEDLIDDGDLVVVSPSSSAGNGDVVVALLTNGTSEHGVATLKRYFRERQRIRLQPATRTLKPIYVQPEDIQIQGKLMALIRRV